MAATHHDPYRERSQESKYDLAPLRFPQLDASKQELFTLPPIHQEFGELLPPPRPPPSAPVSLSGVECQRSEVPEIWLEPALLPLRLEPAEEGNIYESWEMCQGSNHSLDWSFSDENLTLTDMWGACSDEQNEQKQGGGNCST